MSCSRFVGCAVLALLAVSVNTAASATRGIWLSPEEVRALPVSGTAWENVRSAAYGSWGTPNIADQKLLHSGRTVGGALVYVRNGDSALRTKVRDAIIAAKRTADEPEELNRNTGDPSTTLNTLALGRQLGGYVIAADLIDLASFDPAADAEFRSWLDAIRTTTLPLSNSNWPTLVITHEKTANNWGTYAGASRIAASLYLGDDADVTRAASVFRAWLGERSYYPPDAPGQNGYFKPTAVWDASWICNLGTWTAVSPACIKSGIDLNGVPVEDIAQGGGLAMPPGSSGIMYTWEALAGVFVQAEMLQRIGYDPYNWSNQALRRAMDFMVRAGWGIYNVHKYVPWIANYRYGTSYTTNASVPSGRLMGWTDWTHGSGSATTPPPDVTPPAAVRDLGP